MRAGLRSRRRSYDNPISAGKWFECFPRRLPLRLRLPALPVHRREQQRLVLPVVQPHPLLLALLALVPLHPVLLPLVPLHPVLLPLVPPQPGRRRFDLQPRLDSE